LHITERMIYNIDRYDPEVLMQSQNVTERQEADLTFADLSAVTDDAQFRQVLSAAAEGGSICRSRRGVEVLDYDTVAALVGDPCLDSQDASVYERMGGPPSLLRFADSACAMSPISRAPCVTWPLSWLTNRWTALAISSRRSAARSPCGCFAN
jgi:hypothetical protein